MEQGTTSKNRDQYGISALKESVQGGDYNQYRHQAGHDARRNIDIALRFHECPPATNFGRTSKSTGINKPNVISLVKNK